jgi:hypothetical protein
MGSGKAARASSRSGAVALFSGSQGEVKVRVISFNPSFTTEDTENP